MNDPAVLRHELHSLAELAHQEEQTAVRIRDWLRECAPDKMIEKLGGHGIAAVFRGKKPGSRVMVRCDLDALPIAETLTIPYASQTPGVSHKCGHDGHMAIMCGLAARLGKVRPDTGSVTLLFQPAEETGEGAQLVLADAKFDEIRPNYIFALHNLPGFPLHQVIIRAGVFASASVGWIARIKGATSHAAEPQAGLSPVLALSSLLASLNTVPQQDTALHEKAQVTVIHANLGEQAFGTSPGEAVIMATLRAYSDVTIKRLIKRCSELAQKTCAAHGLQCAVEMTQEFPATVNHPDAVSAIQAAASQAGLTLFEPEHPFTWSEDFGRFTSKHKGAIFGLGAGVHHPPLHHPDYDFPNALIESGIEMLHKTVDSIQKQNTDG